MKKNTAVRFAYFALILTTLIGCESLETRGRSAERAYYSIVNSCEAQAETIGYEKIKTKTNFFNSDDLSDAMLDSEEFADESDRPVIAALAKLYSDCGEKLVQHSSKFDGDTAAFLRALDVGRSLRQLESLHNQTLSWGQFNSEMRRFDLAFVEAFKEVQRTHWEGLYAQRHAREMALLAVAQGLQAYGRAYGDTWRQQQATGALPSLPPQTSVYDPKTLTCRTAGNQTFCTQTSALTVTPKTFSCVTNGNQLTCQSN
jgi:hypothetical protein